MDELGRGTSSEEGVGICYAVCEHLLHSKVRAPILMLSLFCIDFPVHHPTGIYVFCYSFPRVKQFRSPLSICWEVSVNNYDKEVVK